jgi:pimeloyl-ACP methyl ester carboxylesterase
MQLESVKVERRVFEGVGVKLVADVTGDPAAQPVLLMHGGGQTRFSWSAATLELGRRGYHAVSLDLRGHGESDWAPGGAYDLSNYRDDVLRVIDTLPATPVIVGASLGGMTGMLAIGETGRTVAKGLVLVDITPRVEPEGVRRIHDFMTGNLDGFENLEQVADAIAAYNPHRPRPKRLDGLMKNLRKREGRFFWHWDPAMLHRPENDMSGRWHRVDDAARNIKVPTLLVKGSESDIVSDETVAHMVELMPHADYVDITGAGHMVAGDRNDAFNSAIFSFLEKHGL